MKSWIILIVLAVALTAAATVVVPLLSADLTSKDAAYPAPAKADGPAPVAEVVEDLNYGFGTLPHMYSGKHTWTFKNAGAGPLELRGSSKTCSCTTATLFGEHDEKTVTLKPGETMPIDVTFVTKAITDKWSQNVTVGTNDPNRPTIILRVEGAVKPAITTVPADPSISFGVVSNEDEVVRRVALFSEDRPETKVLKVTASNPALIGAEAIELTPEQAKSLGVQRAYAIEVKLKPSSNLGAFAEEVAIETDHPSRSELRFRVAGKVTGIIAVIPEKITIRGANASDGGTEILRLLSRGQAKVQFTVLRKPDAIDLVIEPITLPEGTKGSQYKMTARLVPGTVPGRVVGEVVLKTDDPKASEVKVPVDVLVQGAR